MFPYARPHQGGQCNMAVGEAKRDIWNKWRGSEMDREDK